jgi:malate permease and related proteins
MLATRLVDDAVGRGWRAIVVRSPDEQLERYLSGWAAADLAVVLSAVGPGFRFEDPLVGIFDRYGLRSYAALLRERVGFATLRSHRRKVCFEPFPAGGRPGPGHWFWRSLPETGLAGTSTIELGPAGVQRETVCYEANLATEQLRRARLDLSTRARAAGVTPPPTDELEPCGANRDKFSSERGTPRGGEGNARGRAPAVQGPCAMPNLILLIVCFLLGVMLRRLGRLPEATPATLNAFIIHVSLPALTLLYVHELPIDRPLAYPAAMAWVLFGLGVVFFVTLGRAAGWSRGTVGGLILVGGLANTSFLGLPMIETFYGEAHLGLGILIGQLGTYMVLSTLGILIAVTYAAGAASPAAIAGKILRFPPFQAMLLALALKPLAYPEGLEIVLGKLGATLAPLAVVSVACQLRLGDLRGRIAALSAGLAFKLVMGPAVIMALFAGALGARGATIQVTIFEAAMAPMIGASIVALEHKLDPPLVTLMVGIGIPLSFLTLPLWWYVLQAV